VVVDAEPRLVPLKAISSELLEDRLDVVDLEKCSVLRRITSVFSKADTYSVPLEQYRGIGIAGSADDDKSHDSLIEGCGFVDVRYGKVQYVFLVGCGTLDGR